MMEETTQLTTPLLATPLLTAKLTYYATHSPNKTALTFLKGGSNGGTVERQLTYAELEEETDVLSRWLLDVKGLKRGDRAVLVYPPSLDFLITFLACLKAGIIAVPVFPPNPARKDTLLMFSKIVEGCDAKHALTSGVYNHLKKLAGVKDAFTKIKKSSASPFWPEQLDWIVTDKPSSSKKTISPETPSFDPSHLAFLQYTSGSTSEPKGVMISHANLSHNLSIITSDLGASTDTTVVSWLPQYHDMGLIGSYLGIIYCGGSGFYLSPLTFLQRPMVWIEAVSRFKGTHLQAPNFAFKLTAKKFNPSNYKGSDQTLDLSSVKHMINAAEPVDKESIDKFMNSFETYGLKKGVMFPTYGLAEHTVFVCSGGTQILTVKKEALEVDGNVIVDSNEVSEGTVQIVGCGYPARQNVNVRIVNINSFAEVEEDVVGEIWVDSPSKAQGYFQKPDETAADFHAKLSTVAEEEEAAVNYLRTGDLGFMHNNELFICGRLKDLIIVGGRNYYPQDIEATAESVSDALRPGCSAAFSVDVTGAGGEEVALLMELREVPKKQDMERCASLIAQLRSAINQEHSLAITHIVLLEPRTIPKTTSGKIARAWCRKAFLGKTLKIVSSNNISDSSSPSSNVEEPKSENINPAEDAAKAQEIRALDNTTILAKLKADIGRLGNTPPDTVDTTAPLISILDSISISQFKGMLELEYCTKLSDEYLFLETTSASKLVEVVKLGYAPDDSGNNNDGNTSGSSGGGVASGTTTAHGKTGGGGASRGSGGLAGAMGCPPGVVCCSIM